MMNPKLDLKKIHRNCYTAGSEPKLIQVPDLTYIAFDGEGNPGTSPLFAQAMGVLYGLVYTAKFMCKEREQDFTVMPLEGTWWSENMDDFLNGNKDSWKWTVMIAVPDYLDQKLFEEAREKLAGKKDVPGLEKGYRQVFGDGLSVQLLHIGPYSGETENIRRLHIFAEEQGCRLAKKHREIYLSDPNRTAPGKLKTIIRQPVEKI